MQEPIEEGLAKITEIRDSDLKWDEKIAEAIRTHLIIWYDYYGAVFTTTSEFCIDVNSGMGEHIISLLNQYRVVIADIIQQGIEAGEIYSDLDPKIMFLGLLGMCSWMYKWYSQDGPLSVEEIARQFSKMFINGIKTRQLPAKP